MLCCEGCELWVHASCYKIRKSSVPDHFYCEVCRPPPTELSFADVEDSALRTLLEGDRDALKLTPQQVRVKTLQHRQIDRRF
jgi:hypothetical protein